MWAIPDLRPFLTGALDGRRPSRRLVAAVCLVVAPLIFIADTVTDPSITVATLYAVLIIIVVRTKSAKYILLFCVLSCLLTLTSVVISPGLSAIDRSGAVGLGLSLFSILATSYLAVQIVTAEAAARRAQAQIAQAIRGFSLADLATSVAHELNQPLAATVANASAARRWLDRVPPDLIEARAAIKDAVRDAERAGEVVNGLRRLVALAPPSNEPIDIAALLSDTVELVQPNAAERGIDVETSIPRPLPSLWGDRVLLQQALLNLLFNALEALDEVGLDDRKVSVTANVRGPALTIAIRDTGPGIAPEAIGRLFEPFRSTKASGMGIGLALTRSIAEAHGARLTVSPCVPRGTSFELEFPTDDLSGKSGRDG